MVTAKGGDCLTVSYRGQSHAEQIDPSGKRLYTATIIPNRGAWLEFETDVNDHLFVRIDRTRKIPASVLIRALGYGSNAMIVDLFGENKHIQETLTRDNTDSEEEALVEIYKRLRPGEPPTVESARSLLQTLFFDPKRYDLANVGRYKIQKKLKHGILYRYPEDGGSEEEYDPYLQKYVPKIREFIRELTPEDIMEAVRYLLGLIDGNGTGTILTTWGTAAFARWGNCCRTSSELACPGWRGWSVSV